MKLLKRLAGNPYLRIWAQTVAPTAVIFIGAAVYVRAGVFTVLRTVAPESVIAFYNVFTSRFILTGAAGAILLSTALTHLFLRRTLNPMQSVVRLTKEITSGNYSVRADVAASADFDYQQLATNVNVLAESLERTERLRRELVSNLAHEIRTPLTNLQGYLEALRDGVIEANQEALDSVHEEVLRLVKLVDALHQLARADAMRQQPLERTPFDMDHLAEHLVRVVKGTAEAKRIRVFFDAGTARTPVPVHADSMAQVMRNLLRNAVQYTNDAGVIRVQSSVVDGVYRFVVLNTGPGIAPEDLPFIFKRFYRTDRAKAGVKTGVGIGLAICKELVEAHGGRIGVQSKSGWTQFWLELPMDVSVRLDPDSPNTAAARV
ncbi:MAG TPA: HAMP domain-containing sensor histidine kinase [Symbiobacteriaceae bacterium]|nr:HAMP domain-containing sensor histidine kinase [Symbiobacteriaceae bacterium]